MKVIIDSTKWEQVSKAIEKLDVENNVQDGIIQIGYTHDSKRYISLNAIKQICYNFEDDGATIVNRYSAYGMDAYEIIHASNKMKKLK